MHAAVDHDDIQPGVILQDLDIGQRIAVDEDTVRVETRLDLAQFVLAHEEFGDAGCGGDDGFVWCEAEEIGEVGEVLCVCSVWCPGEAIISVLHSVNFDELVPRDDVVFLPPWKHHNTPSVHLTQG